jgi:hypothetical protein
MESYIIRVTGRNKQQVKQFSIQVSVEPKNITGGFLQWIGNSRNKDAVSAWLANYCPGYEELSANGVNLIR